MAESKYKCDDPKAAFAEADKRIELAVKSGAKKADFNGLGLAEVSDDCAGFGLLICSSAW